MDYLNLKPVIETVDLLNRTLRGLIIPDRGMHAETLVASSARMAGTMLLRHQQSELVLSESDNLVESQGIAQQVPVLVQTPFATPCQPGLKDTDENGLAGSRASTRLSRLSLSETQAILAPWFRRTLDGSQLTLCEIAASTAMTTALLIHDGRDELDVHAGCTIATDGFVGPIKSIPAASIAAVLAATDRHRLGRRVKALLPVWA